MIQQIKMLSQADDRPAAFARVALEGRIGVHRHRVGDLGQQRQVVERIAVEPAAREAMPVVTEAAEPGLDAGDLAFAEAGDAADAAGEPAIRLLRLGGDQVGDAEHAGDRRGDEAVGGGDDGGERAFRLVAAHQLAALGGDDGQDARGHEIGMPGIELAARVAR